MRSSTLQSSPLKVHCGEFGLIDDFYIGKSYMLPINSIIKVGSMGISVHRIVLMYVFGNTWSKGLVPSWLSSGTAICL